jgi:hypothetical protein
MEACAYLVADERAHPQHILLPCRWPLWLSSQV